jgi:hypothetical protein
LHGANTERRGAPRYPAEARLFASLDGDTVRLYDISMTGVALRAPTLRAGASHLLEIHLNRRHVAIVIEIVERSHDGLVHARFVEPAQEVCRLIEAHLVEACPAPGVATSPR